jgi:hypothetical protein
MFQNRAHLTSNFDGGIKIPKNCLFLLGIFIGVRGFRAAIKFFEDFFILKFLKIVGVFENYLTIEKLPIFIAEFLVVCFVVHNIQHQNNNFNSGCSICNCIRNPEKLG